MKTLQNLAEDCRAAGERLEALTGLIERSAEERSQKFQERGEIISAAHKRIKGGEVFEGRFRGWCEHAGISRRSAYEAMGIAEAPDPVAAYQAHREASNQADRRYTESVHRDAHSQPANQSRYVEDVGQEVPPYVAKHSADGLAGMLTVLANNTNVTPEDIAEEFSRFQEVNLERLRSLAKFIRKTIKVLEGS